MTTPEMLEYISAQRAAGISTDEIRSSLIRDGGWNEVDVIEAFSVLGIGGSQNSTPVSTVSVPVQTDSIQTIPPPSFGYSTITADRPYPVGTPLPVVSQPTPPSVSEVSTVSASEEPAPSGLLSKILTVVGVLVVVGGLGFVGFMYWKSFMVNPYGQEMSEIYIPEIISPTTNDELEFQTDVSVSATATTTDVSSSETTTISNTTTATTPAL